MIQILARRSKNNPLLLGEPGVGKTAIAEGKPAPQGCLGLGLKVFAQTPKQRPSCNRSQPFGHCMTLLLGANGRLCAGCRGCCSRRWPRFVAEQHCLERQLGIYLKFLLKFL